MQDHDVPVTSINNVEEVFESPQAKARNMLTSIDHPTLGKLDSIGIPVKLKKTPGRITRHPPLLGEHTEEILRELGYQEFDINKLKRDGVL